MKTPSLVAHRGQMETYPENTLLGIEAALQCGATYVEFDVQSTADGVLVVFHDVELERVTGVVGNLFKMQYESLNSIRVSEPGRFAKDKFSEPISTLKDVVNLLLRYPEATAFVEIKNETVDQFGVEKICSQLLKEIQPIQQQSVVISFHKDAIQYTKDNSAFKTGYVLEKYDAQYYAHAQALSPDYLIVNHTKLIEGEAPWAGQWEWMLYDITDPELCLKYANEVSFIETRDICSMLKQPMFASKT
jgi:glycerophosphoryl diester phosphodiesterase